MSTFWNSILIKNNIDILYTSYHISLKLLNIRQEIYLSRKFFLGYIGLYATSVQKQLIKFYSKDIERCNNLTTAQI